MKTIKVNSCADCPFFDSNDFGHFCDYELSDPEVSNINVSIPEITGSKPIPDFCPLKTESVKIKLK